MSIHTVPHYAADHQGARRLEAAFEAAGQWRSGWSATRGLVVLLLSAVLAAAVAVAYQVMDTAEEGHLLALWIALWVAVFAGLALFAGSNAAKTIKTSLNAWAHRQALARADERLWRIARTDARVMADLQNAMSRVEVAMLTETDINASLSAKIPSSLVTSRQRSYGFYI